MINIGDKVEFAGEILTVNGYDSWFCMWTFKERSFKPYEYKLQKLPKKIGL